MTQSAVFTLQYRRTQTRRKTNTCAHIHNATKAQNKKQRLRRALAALYGEYAQLQVTTNEPRYYKHAAEFETVCLT